MQKEHIYYCMAYSYNFYFIKYFLAHSVGLTSKGSVCNLVKGSIDIKKIPIVLFNIKYSKIINLNTLIDYLVKIFFIINNDLNSKFDEQF